MNKKEIIARYKKVFEKHGTSFLKKNIDKIPFDNSDNVHNFCTVDVFALTNDGLVRIFFKGKNRDECFNNIGFMNPYFKYEKTDKFLYKSQLNFLRK